MARKKKLPGETMTVGTFTLNLASPRQIKDTTLVAISVIVFDENTVPADQFDLFNHNGFWYAWTADTLSDTRIQRRCEFAAEYNRRKGFTA